MGTSVADTEATFGSRPRHRRPVLLLIVLGVLLALVGITATAQALMVSVYSSTSTLNAIVQSDVATVRGFLHGGLDAGIAEGGQPTPAQEAQLQDLMATLVSKGELLRVELRRPDGTILGASEPGLAGATVAPSADFQAAVAQAAPELLIVDAAQAEAGPGSLGSPTVLREYLPIAIDGKVVLVAGLWRDAVPILGQMSDLRRDVVLVTLTAALIAAATLFFVFRAAQGRISRQTDALIEASRRDALTGTLNHGSLVGLLAQDIERARTDDKTIAVALLDLDGFRLLNDNHGHRAGDLALSEVARLISTDLPEDVVMGRYGPDEFLVIAPDSDLERLEALVTRVRADLTALSLQFESTERLPVTLSAGLCAYPRHGASVTALLSSAVRTLELARAGGGDTIRVASDEPDVHSAAASSFDVLKGLVLAVDTKDRYTKRHSEDVARYALFIGQQIGLDEDLLRTIRVSGLLHDIGKIGIPDLILRKPGRLTDAEMDVIRQHVALGDMIVRELPDLDTVRAGIRHHHERWDGRGYLAALAGEDIPLIARVLAVADAFSAMTTTRPYRKALSVHEALTRLEDVAGSQLDERLVVAFVRGIRTAADPPLPGESGGRLWTPAGNGTVGAAPPADRVVA